MMVSGGDTSGGDGKHGGHSARGSMHYSDDTHLIRHGEPGILSMINVGKDLYGSQFFITTSACSHLGTCRTGSRLCRAPGKNSRIVIVCLQTGTTFLSAAWLKAWTL